MGGGWDHVGGVQSSLSRRHLQVGTRGDLGVFRLGLIQTTCVGSCTLGQNLCADTIGGEGGLFLK